VRWLMIPAIAMACASSLAAQTPMAVPGTPGWQKTDDGCLVWNEDPYPDDRVTWTGPCPNGRASGRGVLVWHYAGMEDRYEGDLHDGTMHGRGILTSADGSRYEGDFWDGTFEGRGILTYDGARYEGEFGDGLFHGYGTYVFADGGRFEGEFRDDYPHGQGTLWSGNDTFSGWWTDGCLNDGNQKAWVFRQEHECD
jgi:hypothetical protein